VGQVLELAHVDGLVLVDADRKAAEAVAARVGLQLIDLEDIDRFGVTSFSTNPSRVNTWVGEPNPPYPRGHHPDSHRPLSVAATPAVADRYEAPPRSEATTTKITTIEVGLRVRPLALAAIS